MAETEMVERVARALYAATPFKQAEGGYHEQSDVYRRSCLLLARAAIEAMREPTEAMVDAFVWYGHGKTIGDVARIGWQSMIDAALSGQDLDQDAAAPPARAPRRKTAPKTRK